MIETLFMESVGSGTLGTLARNFMIGAIVAVVMFIGYLVLKRRYNLDLVEMLRPRRDQAKAQASWTAGVQDGLKMAQVGTGLEVKVVEASQDHVTLTLGQELVIVVRRLPHEKAGV